MKYPKFRLTTRLVAATAGAALGASIVFGSAQQKAWDTIAAWESGSYAYCQQYGWGYMGFPCFATWWAQGMTYAIGQYDYIVEILMPENNCPDVNDPQPPGCYDLAENAAAWEIVAQECYNRAASYASSSS